MSARNVVESVTSSGMSATPGGYRIEGDKYWIAPDGEAHECSDHSDWAQEQFDLPDDEGDGEKAGENIVAGRDEGYADVHTEREGGTGEQYVYVRVPWSKLLKAQRETVKRIADELAAVAVDDTGRRPVEVYSARGMRTD